jgi:hypothetical protein
MKPEHLSEEQRKILHEVALTYRRARRAGRDQSEAVNAAIAEYRRLSPFAMGDKLAVSGEVNRMIAAAINVNLRRRKSGSMSLSVTDRLTANPVKLTQVADSPLPKGGELHVNSNGKVIDRYP